MTKHNLKPCLAWLLQQHHNLDGPLNYDTVPLSSSITSSIPIDSELFPLSSAFEREAKRDSSETGNGSSVKEEEEDMAKLQLAPQSVKKSKLLAQSGSHNLLPTPAPSRSPLPVRPVAEECSKIVYGTPRNTASRSSVKTPATVYEDSIADPEASIFDIDEIDLSADISFEDFGPPTRLWREDVASRPEPVTKKRGKKRKSDEYENDLHSPPSSQRSRKSGVPPIDNGGSHNRSALELEIAPKTPKKILIYSNGEDVSQRPTHPSSVRALRANGEFDIADITSRTGTCRKTSSQCLSAGDHHSTTSEDFFVSPDQASRIEDSSAESGASRRVRNVIVDAEEEEEATRDHKGIAQKRKTQPAPAPKLVDDDDEAYKLRSNRADKKVSGSGPRSPVPATRADPKTGPSPGTSLVVTANEDHHSSQMTVDNLKTTLSQQERDILRRFTEVPDHQTQKLVERLENSWRHANKKMAEQLCEEGTVSPELQEKSRVSKVRLLALRELQTRCPAYLKQCEQRIAQKRKLDNLLENGHEIDPLDASSEVTRLCQDILRMKSNIDQEALALFGLLQQAGLPNDSAREDVLKANVISQPQVDSPLKPQRNILVASSQHPKKASPSRSCGSPQHEHLVPNAQPGVQTPPASRPLELKAAVSLSPTVPQSQLPDRAAFSPLRPAQPAFSTKGFRQNSIKINMDGSQEDKTFSRNMGSPIRPFSITEDFDDNPEDDNDLLNITEAFEQTCSSAVCKPNQRSILSEIDHNVRREKYPSDKAPDEHSSATNLLQYPWSKDVSQALRKRFQLRGFRHNQLEAINATLGGKDAFVLMPTGGGKSLCYQLPSVIQSGRTSGVTVVISPLLSLMQDQVDHLKRLKIQAFLINSEVTPEHRKFVLSALRGPRADEFIQLLYVTPEMLNKSQVVINAFHDLHKKNKLARIVIDEAHCVSQWGHDFRPDYKALGAVRKQFPGVPVMALTATATENVKVDVIHNLGMDGCDVFTQSFNRPNLFYEIRPKKKNRETLESIAHTINSLYKGQSGIIYCLSRSNCEKLAAELRSEYDIKAQHYHAGMDAESRKTVQKNWQAGKDDVIVATIAFGMGIDKPDVRFVIHHTIPKSLEGYYQETGRAGRDGKRSGCYLYYGYGDTIQLKRMINESDGSFEQKERQKQMLRNVVQFCENKSDCRRVQVLAYFNEHFRRDQCQEGCDNCVSGHTFRVEDYTAHAKSIIRLVRRIHNEDVTLLHCVDIYRGSKTRKDAGRDAPEFGLGSALERGDVERIFYRLINEDALEEYNVVNKIGFATQYVKVGRRAKDYEDGRKSLQLQVRVSPNGKAKSKAKAARIAAESANPDGEADHPASTNVSSPIQARSRKRRVGVCQLPILNDEDDDDDDEGDDIVEFPEIRKKGIPLRRTTREPGPPITSDEFTKGLSDIHLLVLDDFVQRAKESLGRIVISKSLKRQPISDTVLRSIGTEFPQTREAMLEIDGIDEEKYDLYGSILLKLSKQAYETYREMMKGEDQPIDPNRQPVLVISDDDDEGADIMEQDFEVSGDESELDRSQTSQYFTSRAEVDRFNAQGS